MTTSLFYISKENYGLLRKISFFSGVLKRMEWLLELMGYIRNVAYQSTSVQNVALDEVQSKRQYKSNSLKCRTCIYFSIEEHVAFPSFSFSFSFCF